MTHWKDGDLDEVVQVWLERRGYRILVFNLSWYHREIKHFYLPRMAKVRILPSSHGLNSRQKTVYLSRFRLFIKNSRLCQTLNGMFYLKEVKLFLVQIWLNYFISNFILFDLVYKFIRYAIATENNWLKYWDKPRKAIWIKFHPV